MVGGGYESHRFNRYVIIHQNMVGFTSFNPPYCRDKKMTKNQAAYQRLESAVANLPPKIVEQVADYAEYLKSREEWEATQEILNDPSMRRDVEEGRAQAKRGEGRPWREVQKGV